MRLGKVRTECGREWLEKQVGLNFDRQLHDSVRDGGGLTLELAGVRD